MLTADRYLTGWRYKEISTVLSGVSALSIVLAIMIGIAMLNHFIPKSGSSFITPNPPAFSYEYSATQVSVKDGNSARTVSGCDDTENILTIPGTTLLNCFRIRTNVVLPIIGTLTIISCLAFFARICLSLLKSITRQKRLSRPL